MIFVFILFFILLVQLNFGIFVHFGLEALLISLGPQGLLLDAIGAVLWIMPAAPFTRRIIAPPELLAAKDELILNYNTLLRGEPGFNYAIDIIEDNTNRISNRSQIQKITIPVTTSFADQSIFVSKAMNKQGIEVANTIEMERWIEDRIETEISLIYPIGIVLFIIGILLQILSYGFVLMQSSGG